MSDHDVFCPDCGSPMVIRTARKGQHAGKRFYGCSNFPRCKRVVDIDNNGNIGNAIGSESILQEDSFVLPREIKVREKFTGYQVRIFDSLAVADEVLKDCLYANVNRNDLTMLSKWRMDYPTADTYPLSIESH
ncbi:MAG: topoisomerase DNA-binding C4 zinc finger domain-containing protein [Parabacteroides sp.]|nr:topoisomerase DNA-binding C4 zinc finger domain-containing protein [Parabacteroides sp.]